MWEKIEKTERLVALTLFLTLSVGPWTPHLFTRFGLSEFESFSVVDMTVRMLGHMWVTFLTQWSFLAVPIVLIIVRASCPRLANVLQLCLLFVAQALSILALPLLWLPNGLDSHRTHHPLGDVLVSDVVTMSVVHAGLILARVLPAWSFSCGPLFGLCYTVQLDECKRLSSLFVGVAALYANIGALHRGYRLMNDVYKKEIFVQTHSIDEWLGIELYAGLTVVMGFLVICASLPPPSNVRSWSGAGSFLDMAFYIILLNANVGAAWIASRGVFRPGWKTASPMNCILPASRVTQSHT